MSELNAVQDHLGVMSSFRAVLHIGEQASGERRAASETAPWPSHTPLAVPYRQRHPLLLVRGI